MKCIKLCLHINCRSTFIKAWDCVSKVYNIYICLILYLHLFPIVNPINERRWNTANTLKWFFLLNFQFHIAVINTTSQECTTSLQEWAVGQRCQLQCDKKQTNKQQPKSPGHYSIMLHHDKEWHENRLPVCESVVWGSSHSQWWPSEVLWLVKLHLLRTPAKGSKMYLYSFTQFYRSHFRVNCHSAAQGPKQCCEFHQRCYCFNFWQWLAQLKFGPAMLAPHGTRCACTHTDFCLLVVHPPPFAPRHTPKVTLSGMLEGQTE